MGSSGFGTPAVALATTPTVVSTFFSHIFAKRKRRSSAKKSLAEGGPGGGPENQLSYEEGLKVVRRFIEFSENHGVEEVQAFTAMAVPTPREHATLGFPRDRRLISRLGQEEDCARSAREHLKSRGDLDEALGELWTRRNRAQAGRRRKLVEDSWEGAGGRMD